MGEGCGEAGRGGGLSSASVVSQSLASSTCKHKSCCHHCTHSVSISNASIQNKHRSVNDN